MRHLLWFLGGFTAAILALLGVMVGGLLPGANTGAAWGWSRAEGAMPLATPTLALREIQRVPTATPLVVVATATPTPVLSGLTWQREGGLQGRCVGLRLDERSQAHFASCDEGPRLAALTQEELRAYLAFVTRYAPFEYLAQESAKSAQGQVVRVRFLGLGAQRPTLDEQVEVATWCAAVYARLAREERQGELVAQARFDLARQLGLAPDALRTVLVEEVVWPDACLGIHTAGLFCAAVTTPGYRVLLEADGRQVEYRTDQYALVRRAP
jgi:hypothetical protein